MKTIIAILLAFFAFQVSAADKWHSSLIQSVYPLADGGIVLTFKTPAPDCTRSDKYHYILVGQFGVTQEGLNNMLSIVLTAAATGKEVNIFYDTTSDKCAINRLNVQF